MTNALRLYIDENIIPELAEQLAKRGIDAVSVRQLGLLGDTDENHLRRAAELGRVLVTNDQDFLVMVANDFPHCGVIFGTQQYPIGFWVRELEWICSVLSSDEMVNKVEFI